MSTDAQDCLSRATRNNLLVLEPARHARSPLQFLGAGKHLIGSGDDCSVRINVEGVQPHHAMILIGDQVVLLKALDTKTWVNDGVVTEASLRIGDRLSIGPITYCLRLATEAETQKHASEQERRVSQPIVTSHPRFRSQARRVTPLEVALNPESTILHEAVASSRVDALPAGSARTADLAPPVQSSKPTKSITSSIPAPKAAVAGQRTDGAPSPISQSIDDQVQEIQYQIASIQEETQLFDETRETSRHSEIKQRFAAREEELKQLANDLSRQSQRLKERSDRITGRESELEAKTGQLNAENERLVAVAEKTRRELAEEYARQLALWQEWDASYRRTSEELKSQMQTLEQRRSAIQAENEKLLSDRAELQKLRTEFERDQRASAVERQKTAAETDDLQNLRSSFEAERREHFAKLQELELQVAEERRVLVEAQNELLTMRQQLEHDRTQFASDRSSESRRREEEVRENMQVRIRLNEEQSQLQSTRFEIDAAQNELNDHKSELRQEWERLEAEKASVDEIRTKSCQAEIELALSHQSQQELQHAKNAAEDALRRQQDELDELRQEQAAYQELRGKFSEASIELDFRQQMLQEQSRFKESAEETILRQELQLEEQQRQIEEQEQSHAKLSQALDEMSEFKSLAESAVRSQQDKFDEQQRRLEEQEQVQSTLSEVESELERQRQMVQELTALKGVAEESVRRQQEQLDEQQRKLQSQEEVLASLCHMESELNRHRESVQELSEFNDVAEETVCRQQEKLVEQQQRLVDHDEIQDELSRMEAELDQRNQSLEELRRLKDAADATVGHLRRQWYASQEQLENQSNFRAKLSETEAKLQAYQQTEQNLRQHGDSAVETVRRQQEKLLEYERRLDTQRLENESVFEKLRFEQQTLATVRDELAALKATQTVTSLDPGIGEHFELYRPLPIPMASDVREPIADSDHPFHSGPTLSGFESVTTSLSGFEQAPITTGFFPQAPDVAASMERPTVWPSTVATAIAFDSTPKPSTVLEESEMADSTLCAVKKQFGYVSAEYEANQAAAPVVPFEHDHDASDPGLQSIYLDSSSLASPASTGSEPSVESLRAQLAEMFSLNDYRSANDKADSSYSDSQSESSDGDGLMHGSVEETEDLAFQSDQEADGESFEEIDGTSESQSDSGDSLERRLRELSNAADQSLLQTSKIASAQQDLDSSTAAGSSSESVQDEFSVESQLARLLGRPFQDSTIQGLGSSSSAIAPAPKDVKSQTYSVVGASESEVLDRSHLSAEPKHKQDKDAVREEVQSFREVAQMSARTALAKHSWNTFRNRFYFTLSVTSLSLAATFWYLGSYIYGGDTETWKGLTCAGATAVCGYKLIRSSAQLGHYRKMNAATARPTAAIKAQTNDEETESPADKDA